MTLSTKLLGEDYIFFGGLLCGVAGMAMLIVGFKKAGVF